MSAQDNAPTIIKRKKISGGDGHHGGAWKVAYADFVTAMMAFFLLMWLLNATTETQRKGIADYFSPTIPINRISGGGDGAFGGDSIFTEETLAQNGTGASLRKPTNSDKASGSQDADGQDQDDATFSEVEALLSANSGESLVADDLLQHIVTRVTDEGLIVEIRSIEDDDLFLPESSVPTVKLSTLIDVVVGVFAFIPNDIALAGHTRALPVVRRHNENWDLSAQRANSVREAMIAKGTAQERMQRITGHADRSPVSSNPMSFQNERIEITLLRQD
jgi:chemotaxis protein MotB